VVTSALPRIMLEEAILITAAFFVRMLSHADREDERREGDAAPDEGRARRGSGAQLVASSVDFRGSGESGLSSGST